MCLNLPPKKIHVFLPLSVSPSLRLSLSLRLSERSLPITRGKKERKRCEPALFLHKFIYSIFFARAWKARSDGRYVRRSWVQHPVLTRSEITTTGWPPVLVTAWEVLARCVLVLAPTGNGGCYQNSLRAGVVSYF
jgi:hypothetical protein